MPSFNFVPVLDTRAWRTATLSTPFVVQGVIGLLIVNMWLLGKGPFTTESGRSERAWILTAMLITTIEFALVVSALLTSPSSRRRGFALSIASCCIVVFIGAAIFGYLELR
jgi:hypothetical protein